MVCFLGVKFGEAFCSLKFVYYVRLVGIWVYGRCIASFAMCISMQKRISLESGFGSKYKDAISRVVLRQS